MASYVPNTNTIEHQSTKDLFELIPKDHSKSSDLGLFSLLPHAQEDYEEEQFANRMKKKKKGSRL